MIFNEIYSLYYNAVAAIIEQAQKSECTRKELASFVNESVTTEQVATIVDNLKEENWQLIVKDGMTPLCRKPSMPLTTLQKRWLKAISLDARIQLFDADFSFLDEVQPLFTKEQFHIMDVYGNGDDYENKDYQRNFRTLLKAVKENRWVKITLQNRNTGLQVIDVKPLKLEYSIKDDRFRLLCDGYKYCTFNLCRIKDVTSCEEKPWRLRKTEKNGIRKMEIQLWDERNTLERFMTSFSGFNKSIVKTNNKEYSILLDYNRADEIEMVIRILSFGPTVKVLKPQSLVKQIRDRIEKQAICERR